MAWDKNDYYAAFLIIFLLAVGLTIGLWLIGAFPGQRITTVYPFR